MTKAAQPRSTKFFLCASFQGPRAMSWVLLLHAPNHLLSLSLSPSLGTLFPLDHIPVKTCSTIYSTVVLFYPPVSICSTPKYRGLPAC